MRITDIISEDQLDEGLFGKIGGNIARGLGAIPGAIHGAWDAAKAGYQAARAEVGSRGQGYGAQSVPAPIGTTSDYRGESYIKIKSGWVNQATGDVFKPSSPEAQALEAQTAVVQPAAVTAPRSTGVSAPAAASVTPAATTVAPAAAPGTPATTAAAAAPKSKPAAAPSGTTTASTGSAPSPTPGVPSFAQQAAGYTQSKVPNIKYSTTLPTGKMPAVSGVPASPAAPNATPTSVPSPTPAEVRTQKLAANTDSARQQMKTNPVPKPKSKRVPKPAPVPPTPAEVRTQKLAANTDAARQQMKTTTFVGPVPPTPAQTRTQKQAAAATAAQQQMATNPVPAARPAYNRRQSALLQRGRAPAVRESVDFHSNFLGRDI